MTTESQNKDTAPSEPTPMQEEVALGDRIKVVTADKGSKRILIVAGVVAVVGVAGALTMLSKGRSPDSNADAGSVATAPESQSVALGDESPRLTAMEIEVERIRAEAAASSGLTTVASIKNLGTNGEDPNDDESGEPNPDAQRPTGQPATTAVTYYRPDPYKDQTIAAMEQLLKGDRFGASVLYAGKTTNTQASTGSQQAQLGASSAAPPLRLTKLISATTKLYGFMDSAANSDVPGPITAVVAGGPWNGAVLLGKFSRSYEYLVIELNTMSFRGNTYPISAIAIEPDQNSPGLASNVDRHLMYRYGGLFLSSFLGGAGKGVAAALRAQNSVVTSTPLGGTTQQQGEYSTGDIVGIGVADGVGDTAQAVQQSMAGNLNRPVTVTLNRGEPIGVLFLADLLVDETGKVITGDTGRASGNSPAPLNSPSYVPRTVAGPTSGAAGG